MTLQETRVSIILAVAALVVATTLVFAVLTASQTIPNTGNVKAIGVGVYWDSNCTQEVSLIEWEALEPGATSSATIYVCNEGNIAAVLTLTTDNWDPTLASTYLTLGWDLEEGYVLNHGESVQAVLTLSALSNTTGFMNFSFDVIITGTESA